MLLQITAERTKYMHMQHYGKENLKIFTWILLDFAHVPLTFAKFKCNLYPSVILNNNHKYKGICVLLPYH